MVRHNLVVVLGRIVAIVVLLLLNGFFVAVEFALVRSRRTRLEAMARGGDRLARLTLHGIANLGRMLSASQLGITLSSLGLGALTEETLAGVFEGWLHGLPIALEVGLRVSAASFFQARADGADALVDAVRRAAGPIDRATRIVDAYAAVSTPLRK